MRADRVVKADDDAKSMKIDDDAVKAVGAGYDCQADD